MKKDILCHLLIVRLVLNNRVHIQETSGNTNECGSFSGHSSCEGNLYVLVTFVPLKCIQIQSLEVFRMASSKIEKNVWSPV